MINMKIIFYFVKIKFTNHISNMHLNRYLKMHILAKMFMFYKVGCK